MALQIALSFAAARVVAAFAGAALMLVVPVAPAVAQAGDPFCPSGQQAHFALGIEALQEHLGAIMGRPVECEHVDPSSGDTIQHTTTGLAYYRPEINTAIFTNGEEHWALSHDRFVLWRSDSPAPPRPTPAESTYLSITQPIVGRIDALQVRLGQVQEQANRGQLDQVTLADLSDLIGELTRTREAFGEADESARLASYDGLMSRSQDEALAAAGLLLRARMAELPEARDGFVIEAATHLGMSEQLERAAQEAYSRALPIVVG